MYNIFISNINIELDENLKQLNLNYQIYLNTVKL
jgi:hypothetical protein